MRIIVAYDGSDPAKKALDSAIAYASAYKDEENENDKPLIILAYVLPAIPFDMPGASGELHNEMKEQASNILNEAGTKIFEAGIKYTQIIQEGDARKAILDLTKSYAPVNLLAMGSRGYSGRAAIGSTTNYILQHAKCNVLVSKC